MRRSRVSGLELPGAADLDLALEHRLHLRAAGRHHADQVAAAALVPGIQHHVGHPRLGRLGAAAHRLGGEGDLHVAALVLRRRREHGGEADVGPDHRLLAAGRALHLEGQAERHRRRRDRHEQRRIDRVHDLLALGRVAHELAAQRVGRQRDACRRLHGDVELVEHVARHAQLEAAVRPGDRARRRALERRQLGPAPERHDAHAGVVGAVAQHVLHAAAHDVEIGRIAQHPVRLAIAVGAQVDLARRRDLARRDVVAADRVGRLDGDAVLGVRIAGQHERERVLPRLRAGRRLDQPGVGRSAGEAGSALDADLRPDRLLRAAGVGRFPGRAGQQHPTAHHHRLRKLDAGHAAVRRDGQLRQHRHRQVGASGRRDQDGGEARHVGRVAPAHALVADLAGPLIAVGRHLALVGQRVRRRRLVADATGQGQRADSIWKERSHSELAQVMDQARSEWPACSWLATAR